MARSLYANVQLRPLVTPWLATLEEEEEEEEEMSSWIEMEAQSTLLKTRQVARWASLP